MANITRSSSQNPTGRAAEEESQGTSATRNEQPPGSGGTRMRNANPLLARIKQQVRACLPGSTSLPRLENRPRAAAPNTRTASDHQAQAELVEDTLEFINRQRQSGRPEKGKEAVTDSPPWLSSPPRQARGPKWSADGASTSGTKPAPPEPRSAGMEKPGADSASAVSDETPRSVPARKQVTFRPTTLGELLRHDNPSPAPEIAQETTHGDADAAKKQLRDALTLKLSARLQEVGAVRATASPLVETAPDVAPTAPTGAVGGARQAYPKWKGKDRMIVSSDSDSTVRRSALAQRNYRSVPGGNCVKLASLGESHPETGASPLSRMNLGSRLDLHGHGSTSTFEGMSPEDLARRLHDAGLREVGVLKLQTCHVGTKDFLPKLMRAMDARGMKVGYLSGFTGRVISHTKVPSIFGKKINLRLTAGRKTVHDVQDDAYISEGAGLKVIKGNADVGFKGTRYDFAADRR